MPSAEWTKLNSALGVLLAEPPAHGREALTAVQHDLFDLGGELCLPGTALVKEEQVSRLETQAENFNAR